MRSKASNSTSFIPLMIVEGSPNFSFQVEPDSDRIELDRRCVGQEQMEIGEIDFSIWVILMVDDLEPGWTNKILHFIIPANAMLGILLKNKKIEYIYLIKPLTNCSALLK